jgi:phage baseplate assembly protein W
MANSLLPDNDGIATVTIGTQPSYTYSVNYDDASGGDGQIHGFCDKLAAVKQAIFKILNTERYAYVIYSWNYGIELADLIGKPIPFIYAETQRRITEALTNDDRIKSVANFSFSHSGGDVAVTFDVHTIYGTINSVTKEVTGVV